MNEETARYLASYLIQHQDAMYNDLVMDVYKLQQLILQFFEELP